ncbi:hypothetical protein RhiirC2_725347 [Rhizophagus irregularis]|uniref:Uncharacterized protein n=1 Tax=Rhizophagus irregularis TaxID=588596 RepID=A0A2N1P1Q1_9GLOM|nr:hypothetical protein RhiirC2_725347 [Rhizophagus irregularis]
MTCDGKGLFGLGGLGFVMAGEYVLLGFRNSFRFNGLIYLPDFFFKEKIAIVNITKLIFETYYHLIP